MTDEDDRLRNKTANLAAEIDRCSRRVEIAPWAPQVGLYVPQSTTLNVVDTMYWELTVP